MHEAYREVSLVVEEMARKLQSGGDLKTFKETFGVWGKHLLYHAQVEDEYMTGPIKDSQPARNNEAEHENLGKQARSFTSFLRGGEKAALEDSLSYILGFEEQQHKELEARKQVVEELLEGEIGEGAVSTRTRRHLYSRIVALRVAEFDHFDNEETFVFPVIRELMDEQEQLNVVKHLLFDETSDNSSWIFDWLTGALGQKEQKLLLGLVNRLNI
jgi:hemerythrin superfamily protein|tara:strand:- start:1459 stop:2103 length:645 start_codon:yes stop_codon:yes gene_type:complete